MASSGDINSTTSWVKFFTDAGIPHNVAANYAVTFVDNRINKNMLLDLNKEILQDMGINVMGDIIAVLKHAKVVHAQMTRDKVYQEESPVVTVSPARRSTQPNLKRKPEEDEIPVQKVRKIVPEQEGGFVVSLPVGAATKSTYLSKQQVAQPSVFGRLAQKVSPGPTTKPFKTRILTKNASPKMTMETSASVFDRLGPGRGLVSSTTVAQEDEQSLDEEAQSSQLQYKGILKSSPILAKRTVQTKAAVTPAIRANVKTCTVKKFPVAKRLGPKVESTRDILERRPTVKKVLQAATVSSCSEGILAPGAKSKKVITLKNRLGSKAQETVIKKKLLSNAAGPSNISGTGVKVKKIITYATTESAAALAMRHSGSSIVKLVKRPLTKKVLPAKKPSVSVSFVSTSDVFSRLGPAVSDLE